MAKKRIRRKDLKKPDEFLTLTGQALEWMRGHSRVVTWAGAAFVTTLAMLAILSAYRSAQRRDANADLARAMASLRAQNTSGAASELADVAQRWRTTSIAEIAAILAANTQIRLRNHEVAAAEIERLAESARDLPPYLRQEMLVAWGAALAGRGAWTEAAAKYEAAAALSGPLTAHAVLGEARAREQAGEATRARELYRKLYEQFPDFPEREVVASQATSTN